MTTSSTAQPVNPTNPSKLAVQSPHLQPGTREKQQVAYPISLPRIPEEQLKISNTAELARVLSWTSLKLLTWLSRSKSSHYSILYLKKKGKVGKNGKSKLRKLHNPDKLMRIVQYRILTRILDKARVPAYIHGFETGKSIPTMALAHVGKDVVISLDIKDFFPSIKQYMVRNMFQQLGVDEKSAGVLSELTTYTHYVPQGSLTAPKISNLIATGTFGKDLEVYCASKGLSLTIYADDITVSYMEPSTDKEVSTMLANSITSEITEIVSKYRFVINQEKTKIMRRNTRQWVCGAVVNDKVNMMRRERYALRALVHNCEEEGLEAQAAKVKMNVESFIKKYAGRINWMCQLNMDAGAQLKTAFRKVSLPYLKKHPEIEIPELSWNSGIEFPYVPEPEDEAVFKDQVVQNAQNVISVTKQELLLNQEKPF